MRSNGTFIKPTVLARGQYLYGEQNLPPQYFIEDAGPCTPSSLPITVMLCLAENDFDGNHRSATQTGPYRLSERPNPYDQAECSLHRTVHPLLRVYGHEGRSRNDAHFAA